MLPARTCTAALIGVDAHLVEVDAHVSNGPPATILVGLPDTVLRETRDRVRAALLNCGQEWPKRKITIGLSPANLPKRGSGFDLAIAIAIAIASAVGSVPAAEPGNEILFLAELGLDGRLRPVPGVLPAVTAATAHGIRTVVVAAENANEARQVPNVRVVPASGLADVLTWLRNGPAPPHETPTDGPPDGSPSRPAGRGDLADLRGQEHAKAAVEICAAGGHNLLLLGPPGAGKTMLAERLPTILPDLEPAAALEVTSIHSVAGMLPPGAGLITRPPFCAPHHTASKAAIVGGGYGLIRPGAVSLAHRGVLFLDEAPEFHRDVLDALRQPLAAGEVTLARSRMYATFPARFMLVLAASPCPCGGRSGGSECTCSPAARSRYLGRLSGPLLDRIDVKIRMEPASGQAMLKRQRPAEASTVVAQRVVTARERAARRLAGTPWKLNSDIPGAELRRSYPPAPGAVLPLERALELGQISTRGADKVIRVAWSIADLAGRNRPGRDDCALALTLLTEAAPSRRKELP